jgi:hypothetical protein
MNDHVHEWLPAYYDGELKGRKLERVQAHLEHCPECQAELAQLEALSAVLHSDPLPEFSTTPEQFVAQVGLRLPRRTQQSATRRSSGGWRWAALPLAVLGALMFLRSVTWASTALTLIEVLGINPEVVAWLTPSPAAGGLVNPVGELSLRVLGWGVPFNASIFLSLILPLLLAGCYLVWLAVWWSNQEPLEPESALNGSVPH